MMLRNIVWFLCCSLACGVFAQDTSKTTAPADTFGWKQNLAAMLTLTQSAYSNWVQGGDNALAYTATVNGRTIDDERLTNWTTAYTFSYGKTKLNDADARLTDNLIDISSVYYYKIDSLLNPYVSATLLTQFAPGYTYDDSGRATEVSKFFDPAYLTQGVGMGFLPLPGLKERLGAALREIVTSQFTQYANVAGGAQTHNVSVKAGLQSVTEWNWKLDDNLLFNANLSLFAPFSALAQIVVYGKFSLSAKVNKYVSAGLNVAIINERDITPRTQIKEGVGLNIGYIVF